MRGRRAGGESVAWPMREPAVGSGQRESESRRAAAAEPRSPPGPPPSSPRSPPTTTTTTRPPALLALKMSVARSL